MLSFEFEDYKCIFCKQYFNPPFIIPYLLSCTHSICNHCLQKNTSFKQSAIICPEDLQTNLLTSIKIHTTAKKALQRLIKEHKNFNQNNQFLCIQTLSKNLQGILLQQEEEKADFLELIDKIFENQIKRLTKLKQNVKEELYNPVKIVQEWKVSLKGYLQSLKFIDRKAKSTAIEQELNYFIQEGRKIKQQLNFYNNINFQELANVIVAAPQSCLKNQFSIKNLIDSKCQTTNQKEKIITSEQSMEFYLTQKQSKISKNSQKIFKNNSFNTNNKTNNNLNEQQNESKAYIDRNEKQNLNYQKYYKVNGIKSQNSLITQNHNILHTHFTNIQDQNSRNHHQVSSNKAKPICQQQKRALRPEERTLRQLILNQNVKEPYYHYDICKTLKLPHIYDPNLNFHPSKEDEDELLLLNQRQQEKKWQQGTFNFLQQWQIQRNISIQSLKIKKRQAFNWQQQKNNYIRKMQIINVQQALQKTQILQNHTVQLINHSLQQLNFKLYLSKLNEINIQIFKFVKVNMNNQQLNDLLNFMVNKSIITLVLCGNGLTQISLDALLNFNKINQTLRNIYLGKNNINYLRGQTRHKIQCLRQNGLNLYI